MSDACKETGLVTDFAGENRIFVKIRRAEACHSCSARTACFTLGGQSKEMVLELDNTINARPGDEVTLSMPEGSIIKASMVLYLIPAVGLLVGAILGNRLAGIWGMSPDAVSIAGSLVGLTVGFLISKGLSVKMSKESNYAPKLYSITNRNDLSEP